MVCVKKESEQIPLLYPGGIEAFYENEVKPFDSEAVFGEPVIGYEIYFTKYFYKPAQLRTLSDIVNDINSLGTEINSIQKEIEDAVIRGLNVNTHTKDSGNMFIGNIPLSWTPMKMKYLFNERSEKNHPDEPMLSATQTEGVILQSKYKNRVVVVNTGFEGLKLVKVGDFVIHLRSFQGGIEYTYDQGIISSAYTILEPRYPEYSEYFKYLFKSSMFIDLLKTCVTGIREGQNINYSKLKQYFIPVPPLEEQRQIIDYIQSRNIRIDDLAKKLQREIDCIKEYKQRLVADVITGQMITN